MNKVYFIGLVITLLSSCINNKSKNIVVIAKWNFIQSNANNCTDDDTNSPTSCVFNYKGKRYLRGESYKFDLNGRIDSIYSYHIPLGVNVYSIEQYGKYMISLDTLRFNEMKKNQVKWNNNIREITDNNETVNHILIEDNKVIVTDGGKLTIYELIEEKSL
jgi:hypothetical protein